LCKLKEEEDEEDDILQMQIGANCSSLFIRPVPEIRYFKSGDKVRHYIIISIYIYITLISSTLSSNIVSFLLSSKNSIMILLFTVNAYQLFSLLYTKLFLEFVDNPK
jgi:hypothetical protein